MPEFALAAVFAVFVWWVSTGVVLYLDGMPQGTFRRTLWAASVVSVVGLFGLAATRNESSVAGAYLAFSSSVVVWGWHELTFLTGWVTGPRKAPCPEGISEWRRFGYATLTVIYHELALLSTVVLVVVLTWKGANQVGTWTFLVLWLMRLSAKFNLFLGVRNLTEEFIADHLQYLLTYVRRAPLNPLMPVSVAVSVVVLSGLGEAVFMPGASSFRVVAGTLVATMLVLAVLEHLFLVLPVPDAVLWRWALRSRQRARSRAG